MSSTAKEFLLTAADIVSGQREKVHGDKERSFCFIAQIWSVYLQSRKDVSSIRTITEFDVAQMMVLVKMIRANQGTRVEDHFVDQCGYSAIAGELAVLDMEQNS